MKSNYINQFQRQMGDPYHHGGNKQEQSILSIKDEARNFIENKGIGSGTNTGTNTLKWGMIEFAQEREQKLLPIIKELGEALNSIIKISDRKHNVWDNAKTTLDKYKSLL